MSLLAALSVSASGMAAQRTRAELLVQNLANSETTRTPEGGPYRRQDVVFQSAPQTSAFSAVFQTELTEGVTGVEVSEVIQDPSEGEKRYQPSNPDADKDGYVAYPNVNPAEDMVDLLSAQRGYQGNVAAMSAIKDMVQHSIDLLR
ncbi:MAG TPA: flagellar basal body rod protein FlgC [Bryobacteraceae bacterium]|jgi:flagellar basal-body rod protein FlgC|nr:flagellar basal body rod protein FlgC [Bryobacteraceae bacterium]